MKNWINKWFSFSWKKLALVAALLPVMWLVEQDEFPKTEVFIRDVLQHFNETSNIEKGIVTVNINGNSNTHNRPFTFEVYTSIIDKLLSFNPKYIVLCFSIREINASKVNQALLNYLHNKSKVYLQNNYNSLSNNMGKDLILGKYERQLYLSATADSAFGAQDKKTRRVLISFDKQGIGDEFETAKFLGFQVMPPEHFEYGFKFWDTKQIYMKNFKLGTFGAFDSKDIIDDKVSSEKFEGKVIFLGSFDEFSFAGSPSVFNLSDKITGDNFRKHYFPEADLMANYLNAIIKGDYIKLPSYFRDLSITFFILTGLIFLHISLHKKLFLFVSIIPTYLLTTAIVYKFSSFYLDFSSSIVFLFFTQYLGLPIIMFSMFKEQESRKLQEINDARIDALLTVSEKVAHDIRSPLSAINLVMSKASFPDQEYKDIFDSAVQRIDETANKILTRYRTKTGSENETAEPIDLGEICNSIIKEKNILNEKINFELVINTDSTMAMGLKLDLERIISNIMDNSIFALKSIIEPKIFLSIADHDKMLRLSITDNGTGIPEKVLSLLGTARITTKADTGQGNGIGLLHAKRVIERLNGHFEISSQENVGTTIMISLPKA